MRLTRVVFAFVLVLLGSAALATSPASRPDDEPVLRLKVFGGQDVRDWLEREEFDVAGLSIPQSFAEVITDQAGLARLQAAGLHVELIEARRGRQPLAQGSQGQAHDPNLDIPLQDTRYSDPAEIESFLNQVVADHPAITRKFSLGNSRQGRPIWALLISDNAATDEDEPSILFNAAHHAREVMTPEIAIDIIDRLTTGYGVDADMTRRVNDYQILVVPIVNPDGVQRVHATDDFWRKNVRDNDSNGTINSSDGVDLNRNYEWGFGNQCQGSSATISSETYRGPSEGSEPETKALLDLGRKYQPVFDVEYHSYAEAVYYALSCDPKFSPKLSTVPGDGSISRVIGEDLAARIIQADGGFGYSPAPYGSRVDGTGRDQQYHESGSISFVIEVNNDLEGGFHPDYGVWRDPTVNGHRASWQWLIDRIDGPALGGHVRDAVTGLPVQAELSLDELTLPDGKRLSSRSDTGRFHLIVVPGSYTLRVRKPGYQDAVVPVVVNSSAQYLDVLLQPAGATLITSEPFEDSARVAQWTVGLIPGDTATGGRFAWGDPEGTHSGDVQNNNLLFGQPGVDRTPGLGKRCLVTGNAVNAVMASDDVDNGVTSVLSPVYDLTGYYGVEVTLQRWFRKDAADGLDRFDLEVSLSGNNWQSLETLLASTSTPAATPAWTEKRAVIDSVVAPGAGVRFRFRASDLGADNIVEAAVDDFELRGFSLALQGEVRGVSLSGGASTVLSWQAVPGGAGAVYDVVRGNVANLSGGAAGVNLGALTCIENDSTDTATASTPDTTLPAPSESFFYLVRFRLGLSLGGYGTGSAGGSRAGSSGCP